jgi:hypothetical protein
MFNMKNKLIIIISLFLSTGITLFAKNSTANKEIQNNLEQANTETYPKIDSQQYKKYLEKQKQYYAEMNKMVKEHNLNSWNKKNTKIYNNTKDTKNMSKRVRYNYENVYGKPVLNTDINNYNRQLKEQKAYWNKLDTMTKNDEKVQSIHNLKESTVNQEAEETQRKLNQSKPLGI